MQSKSLRASSIPVLGALIVMIIPVVLVLTSVRLLLTDEFVHFEYALPGFPTDPYGFTKADRLRWAAISLEYLLNNDGIEFLADMELEEGTSLYNARELQHMKDVKDIVQIVLIIWKVLLIGLVFLAFLLVAIAGWIQAGRSIKNGAKLTLLLMGILVLGVLIVFPVLFVAFHQIFFDPGTWTFSFQDSLIRLFPQRFWQVAFLSVAIATLAQAGLIYLAGFGLERMGSD